MDESDRIYIPPPRARLGLDPPRYTAKHLSIGLVLLIIVLTAMAFGLK